MAKGGKRKAASGDVASNRQAAYRYNLLERFECGIVLTGTEVKSLREGKAQLKDSYATVREGEVWLIGLYIPPYGPASRENHEPERPRKLLLHRSEIERLMGKTRRARADAGADADLLHARGLAGQGSRSPWPRARTCTTSARRSATREMAATCSGSCAKSAADGRGVAQADDRFIA